MKLLYQLIQMKKQNRMKTGDYLYHYFRKKHSSFLVNIYKAGITATEIDIHKSRVDMKKIFALFGFFEMIGSDLLNIREPKKIFRNVFESAGKIRETQVNLLYIEKLKKNDPELQSFSRYLRNNSKREMKRFMQAIIGFDEDKLTRINKSIKTRSGHIDMEKIISRSDEFFQLHSARIKRYRSHPEVIENIHKIRKEMKKISAIADLLSQLVVDEFMKKLISALNRTELIIGDWHDRIILYNSLDTFITENEIRHQQIFSALEQVKKVVEEEAKNILLKLLPEVDNVVILIAEIPFLRKAGKY